MVQTVVYGYEIDQNFSLRTRIFWSSSSRMRRAGEFVRRPSPLKGGAIAERTSRERNPQKLTYDVAESNINNPDEATIQP